MTDSIFHKPTEIKPAWASCKNSAEIELVFGVYTSHKDCSILRTVEWETRWDTAFTEAHVLLRKHFPESIGDGDYYNNGDLYDSLRNSAPSHNQLGAALALIVYEDSVELLYQDPDQLLMMALLGVQAAILFYPLVVAMN